MAIRSINVVKKIAQRITSVNGSDLVILFNNINPVPDIPDSSIISVNGFLKNLKGYSKITSTPEVALPNIQITDSDQERLFATLDVEWKSQRKHLDLLVSADGNDWIEIGTVSLIRQQGYPYRMHSLLDFFTDGLADEFGNNGKVAVKISDVGYGLLSGDDVVTIHGSYLQEIVYNETALITSPISNQMQVNSINPPPNPQLGAIWNEVDIGNNFIQQWNWFNNGWQSHEKTFTASSTEIVDNNIFGCFHINPKYKYLISTINFVFSPNSNLDFNNYYQLQIYQSKDNKTLQAEVLGADFNNHIANTIYSNVYEANLLHSPFLPGGDLVFNDGTNSTQGFIWSLSRFGASTVGITYSLEINYLLIRR